ncbi:uncharacterized protein BXZ73DRAFT_101766 [Epithele typhae]|uniref:uncharacterized protein n=1 Tax=Epithele typhae TaxID=378194 RepID=UPI0020081C8D|nr:uncharacterized protein BXZ73DRAFT_101766 [Epithele typhae]KAH9931185.1 hypothetical protein BXZ73DRAFT_101766 [Epithele typhae]
MATISSTDLKTSLGALCIGSLVAVFLTGVVSMQAMLYFRHFSRDAFPQSSSVLDLVHTVMIAVAAYTYFVDNFGNENITDRAFWAVGISIALTAVLTAQVHFFFVYRLFRLSKGNYFITVPIAVLATARVGAAFVTTVKLIEIESFSQFAGTFRWVFTLGLVLSCAVDFLITGSLCFYLRRNRTGSGRFDHVLDSVTLYTVENGLLTSLTTLVSLIFWLARPHVLIYLGLHFAISKLYANSFLASMNARKTLLAQSQSTSGSNHVLPVIFTGRTQRLQASSPFQATVQITVDKTVDYDGAGDYDVVGDHGTRSAIEETKRPRANSAESV